MTPDLYLRTLFVQNAEGRILSTREPDARRGALFTLVRSANSHVWATRVDVPPAIVDAIDALAREEPYEERSTREIPRAPIHAERYLSLLQDSGNEMPGQEISIVAGPAFYFPDTLTPENDIASIHDERQLEPSFHGWTPGELAAGRAPLLAIFSNEADSSASASHPVSICFSARSSATAAEAGVETALAFRGRGFAPRVVAAWALAIRASGRVPLYSTSWTNLASLAVARKLGLIMYANTWSLCDSMTQQHAQ